MGRPWKKQFTENGGAFPELEVTARKHNVLRDDEELCERARKWVREHSHVKGQPNIKSIDFCHWVNNELLPNVHLAPGFPRQISHTTALKWLEELGFKYLDYSKGTYVDGHEREDVVAYRKKYLSDLSQKLRTLHQSPLTYHVHHHHLVRSAWSSLTMTSQPSTLIMMKVEHGVNQGHTTSSPKARGHPSWSQWSSSTD